MAFLSDTDRQEISDIFKDMVQPVTIEYFTQDHACHFCKDTGDLLQEVISCSDKIKLLVHDFIADKTRADELSITKIPAFALIGAKDYGIRYYGIPSGYEFSSLIHMIPMVSQQNPGLNEGILNQLKGITKPVHLQVLVTPT
jgi:alkyl hydroperoxide reductase subunit AhpF